MINLLKRKVTGNNLKESVKIFGKDIKVKVVYCKIKNPDTRTNEFNKWCSIDENIRLLEQVFPVIITTNISSARLGTAYHTFDLVIMDEAGQCNSATALLPIARAKQLLLVGDSNQLRPVIVLEDIINEQLETKNKFIYADSLTAFKVAVEENKKIIKQ